MTTSFPSLKSVRNGVNEHTIFSYSLFKANRRLVFDIHHQDPVIIYRGADDGEYFYYKTPNGYEIMSRSRMDLHTERIWVVGAKAHERSGSVVLSSNEKRDKVADEIHLAIFQWMAAIDPGSKLRRRSSGTRSSGTRSSGTRSSGTRSTANASLQEVEFFLRVDESTDCNPAVKWSFDSAKWGSGGGFGNGR